MLVSVLAAIGRSMVHSEQEAEANIAGQKTLHFHLQGIDSHKLT